MKKYLIFLFLFPFFCFAQKALASENPAQAEKDTIKNRTKIVDGIFLQDKISLLVGSNGCFHSVSVAYTFIKKANYYEATYIKMNSRTIKCKGTIKLSIEKIKQISQLCIYGLSLKIGGCTTRVDFELSGKAQKISFNDDRCAEDDIMTRIGEIVGVCEDF
jgi:hypothetical protein